MKNEIYLPPSQGAFFAGAVSKPIILKRKNICRKNFETTLNFPEIRPNKRM
jgi:hypothetical protein